MGGTKSVSLGVLLVMLLAPGVGRAQEQEEIDTVFEPPPSAEMEAAAETDVEPAEMEGVEALPPPPPTARLTSTSRPNVPSGYRLGHARIGSARAFLPPGTVVRTPGEPVDEPETGSRIPRIMTLALAGGATMVGSSFGMYEVGCATQGGHGSPGCMAVGLPMGIAASLSLTPLSVFLAGKLMDGNGGYGWTLLGTAAGTAAGFLGALALLAVGQFGDVSYVPLMIGPTLGAIIAYELSSDTSRSAVEAAERAVHATITPTVAPMNGGGMVGLAGTF